MKKFPSFPTSSGIFALLVAFVLLACEKKPVDEPGPSVTLPAGLTVSGDGIEFGATPHAMQKNEDGTYSIYAEFVAGETIKVTDGEGNELLWFKVTPVKDGVGRLTITGKDSYEIVHIDKVSLVVTEGGSGDPQEGVKPPIEAQYQGDGVWTVKDLYVETDYMRYRFELETDTPDKLKYWCATWNNSGSAPTGQSAEYLSVRALGQKDYEELKLKDNRACWMFPADRVGKLAGFTLSMNAALPAQEIAYSSIHKGPKAAFIGDSITWLWGLDYYGKKTPADMVYPIDPMPSWAKIVGSNIYLYFHKAFFDNNNYINKGISGNNTTQMVNRYKTDILVHDPHCVVIMGGTNDLAQGTTKDVILYNIKTMAEEAEALDIPVILCSVTPCNDTYSNLNNPKTKGAHIVALNAMIKEYADSKGFTWCNYYPYLVAEDGYTLKEEYWMYDHLHPNPDAYTVMEGIIKPIIEEVTK